MTKNRLFLERVAVVVLAAAYLIVFNANLPHGDALRVVRQIEAGSLLWNPNHLLFDPLGFLVARIADRLYPGVDPLASFEWISAVSAVASLYLFHATLVRAGVQSGWLRLLFTAGLFGSASFLSVAVSQYYFMVQMPLLIGVIYVYLGLLQKRRAGASDAAGLYLIGALLALATAIMFNNLLLTMVLGIAVAFDGGQPLRVDWKRSIRLYVAAALVGFPVFLAGHWLSGSDAGLLKWLLAYQGDTASRLNELYGLKWTLSGVLESALMTGFNVTVGMLVELAGLGSVLSVLLFGEDLEFNPQWSRIAISMVAIPVALALVLSAVAYTMGRSKRADLTLFLAGWIAAYLVFNFLWSVGDDIFWLQILPAFWLMILFAVGGASGVEGLAVSRLDGFIAARGPLLGLSVLLLFLVNTVNAVLPVVASGYGERKSAHEALLREGDLEIITGWDQYKWMLLDEGSSEAVSRIVLMNLAVAAPDAEQRLDRLPEIIDSHLAGGGRVIVARLFDRDRDQMPWYALRQMGWPRERIVKMLSTYCTRPLAEIEDVKFRELYRCPD